jgi:hypothetical protein
MAVALITGGIVLLVNRGPAPLNNNLPPHFAATVNELPSVSRVAASHTVDLTVTTPGHVVHVAALVLPHDLAVTTKEIPVNAVIKGSTSTKTNFAAQLIGRDTVMGFSVVRLSVPVTALKLDAMPASTNVVAVAPLANGATQKPEFDWSMTTLGDPRLNSQGVVRYLATTSDTNLSRYVDAVAIDQQGHVVAVLSSRHLWYSARFVAQVAYVLATGRGCHASLGVTGTSEQGGGIKVTKVAAHSAAAVADLVPGDVITAWNGTTLDTWDQLASTLYLTPAYSLAHITYEHATTVKHATVTLECPYRLAG